MKLCGFFLEMRISVTVGERRMTLRKAENLVIHVQLCTVYLPRTSYV